MQYCKTIKVRARAIKGGMMSSFAMNHLASTSTRILKPGTTKNTTKR